MSDDSIPPVEDDQTAMMLGLVPDKRSPERRLLDAIDTGGASLDYRRAPLGDSDGGQAHGPLIYYSTNRATLGEMMRDCEECGQPWPCESADMVERAQHEIAEDRRIAGLCKQAHSRDALNRRADVTAELIAEVTALRQGLEITGNDYHESEQEMVAVCTALNLPHDSRIDKVVAAIGKLQGGAR